MDWMISSGRNSKTLLRFQLPSASNTSEIKGKDVDHSIACSISGPSKNQWSSQNNVLCPSPMRYLQFSIKLWIYSQISRHVLVAPGFETASRRDFCLKNLDLIHFWESSIPFRNIREFSNPKNIFIYGKGSFLPGNPMMFMIVFQLIPNEVCYNFAELIGIPR